MKCVVPSSRQKNFLVEQANIKKNNANIVGHNDRNNATFTDEAAA